MPFINKIVDGDIKAVAGGRRIASRLFFSTFSGRLTTC